MPEIESIADGPTRRLAETTFDRNVVVVAGAGTGKTTLLVNRFVHTLMREPHPVPITQVVALTFTNKAATEMKVRLREQLTTLARMDRRLDQGRGPGCVGVEELRQQYGLSATQVADRANAALVDLESLQSGPCTALPLICCGCIQSKAGLTRIFRRMMALSLKIISITHGNFGWILSWVGKDRIILVGMRYLARIKTPGHSTVGIRPVQRNRLPR